MFTLSMYEFGQGAHLVPQYFSWDQGTTPTIDLGAGQSDKITSGCVRGHIPTEVVKLEIG